MECVDALNSKGTLTLTLSIIQTSITPSLHSQGQNQNPKPLFIYVAFDDFNKTPKAHSTMITQHTQPKQKIGSSSCCCFPWQFGVKKSMAKTVPLEEGSEFADMKGYAKVHSSSWKWKSKSKSLNNTQINFTLNHPLSQSQSQHDSRQHALSLPSSKRHHVVYETTGKDAKQKQKQHEDHVIGACMVIISLISMVVWGRLGSILCTTSFMFLIPTFLKTTNKIPSLILQTTQSHTKMSQFRSS